MSAPALDLCEVCLTEQAESLPSGRDELHQKCPRCGEFSLTGTAAAQLRRVSAKARAQLSGWVREQYLAGSVPVITSQILGNVLQRPVPTVAERAAGLLQEACRELYDLSDTFSIVEPRFMASTYSLDESDVTYLADMLRDDGLIARINMNGTYMVLPRGYLKVDELRQDRTASSSQGFIAMWFEKNLDEAFEKGLQAGILLAGYNPLRIDRVEHVNRIDDEIIRQINASKFVVADFTGHRGGVYFEAGYALGRNTPVFWTCRKSDMSELHFDIRQFNCIDWSDPEELAHRLMVRIEAVLGPGPSKVAPQ